MEITNQATNNNQESASNQEGLTWLEMQKLFFKDFLDIVTRRNNSSDKRQVMDLALKIWFDDVYGVVNETKLQLEFLLSNINPDGGLDTELFTDSINSLTENLESNLSRLKQGRQHQQLTALLGQVKSLTITHDEIEVAKNNAEAILDEITEIFNSDRDVSEAMTTLQSHINNKVNPEDQEYKDNLEKLFTSLCKMSKP